MGYPTAAQGQVERAASLSHAAECLARAAAKLSEAARAMSMVAGLLSHGSVVKMPSENGTISVPPVEWPDTLFTNQITAPEDDGAGLSQGYRLLLDDEADVLLVLCSLIYDRSKVICYFTCGTQSLNLYKSLIDSVIETNAIVPDPSNKSSIASCYNKFLGEMRSIMLLTEADIPVSSVEGSSEYTVIHVGWPVNKNQYVAQRRTHQAPTNILLAYSGDKDLYLSGSALISLTEAWPGDTRGFKTSTDILRPLFKEKLSELSFQTKEEAYLDWISLHSLQGSRSVNSWTPSTLVNQANRFILGPLAYRSPRSMSQRVTLQPSSVELLPEVSAEFVTGHGLQPAVDEGLLRVEADHVELNDAHESAVNDTNQWSTEDTRLRNIPEDTLNHSMQHLRITGEHGDTVQDPLNFEILGIPQINFTLATGHNYFALEEDFDSIPLVWFLSTWSDKTVLFLEGVMLKKYRKLFRHFLSQKLVTVRPDESPASMARKTLEFMTCASSAILLISHSCDELPTALRQRPIGCCIYWAQDLHIKQAKKHQSQITCPSVNIIMPNSRRDRHLFGLSGFKEHPQASVVLDRSSDSLLETRRRALLPVLMSQEKAVQGLYSMCIVALKGEKNRQKRSSQDAVTLANCYAAKVLLYGSQEDGSTVFPPIRGRPSVTLDIVRIFQLQPAVDAGLLFVA
ncbi:unnamed protein product [Rhizoctonia solani]|uniref:Uncharacterized protein n=1 Tax=Rhizoctonia solani TaxID=456999 RepID=A0A8H3DFI0_9AGAM|nr:unnamed protein product [Rhizoctonia solani]CAE6518881.1 unnamed protein product [Rhizoctonia solani]